MKTLLGRFGLLFLLPVLASAASDPSVRVAGSRDLRVSVVDVNKATPARQAMHQAFAAALAEAMAAKSGSALSFKVKTVGADQAAFNLEAGVCDAVFVPSHVVPRQLAGVSVARLSGKRGDSKEVVYLVYAPGDEKLAELLAVAFPAALESPKFLQAFEGVKGPIVAGGN